MGPSQNAASNLSNILFLLDIIVLNLSKYLHISPMLYQLHWLPVQHRVHFKILILKFKAIHGLAPKYIIELRNIKPRSIFIIVDEIKVYGYTLLNGKCLSR